MGGESMNNRLSWRSKSLYYLILLLGTTIMVIPFLWMILTGFKTYNETVALPIVWFPAKWNFDNFIMVIGQLDFGRYYVNTIIVTVLIVSIQLFICSLAAYAFSRMNFPGKNVIFFLLLVDFMVPPQMTIIPKYLIMVRLHWVDTIFGLVVPCLWSVFTVFMLRQFFSSLPKELEDSGKIDGCSYFRLYWNIMLPLCKSAMIAIGVLNVLWAWNNLLWPLIVTSTDKMRVLSVAMAVLQGQRTTQYHLIMAASVMTTAPMLLMYIIGQKHLISGIAFSGIKA
jgi:multiple sugar transport system permease protein